MCSIKKNNKNTTFSKQPFPESARFADFLVQNGLSKNSIGKYIIIVRQYRKRHKTLSQEGVTKFLTDEKHKHPYYFSAIKYYIAFKELAGKGPRSITLPKVRFKDPEPRPGIPRCELGKIIEDLPETINKDALYVLRLLHISGLRIEEGLAAIFGNLYRDEKIKKNILRVKTKGGYIHHVILPDGFFEELRAYAVGKGLLHNDRLFFNQCKNVDSAYRTLRWILESTGKPEIRKIMQTHNFRRGVVNEILDKTGDLLAANAYVGHRKMQTTARYASTQQRERAKNSALDALTRD